MLLFTSCQGARRPASLTSTNTLPQTNRPENSGIYHEVQVGQTLWSIARAYGVQVQTLARANRIADITSVYAGQTLYIPGATQLRQVSSRCPCVPESSPPSTKSILLFSRSSKRSDTTRTESPHSSYTKEVPLENANFVWPIQGQVSRGFEQDATRRHDGIDIAAPQGVPIRAAASGEVMFSGWGPGGYGKTVILQHRAELVTIYAHNDENLVQVGQHVQQGESIATVGQTGRATGSHLHFEVRYKATPISPYKLLPQRSNHVAELVR